MVDEEEYSKVPLPSGTAAGNIKSFMDNVRFKDKISQIKSAVDNYDTLLRLTNQFRLTSEDYLTEMGREYAFGNDEEKKNIMRKIIVDYKPYYDFLINIRSKNGFENPSEKETAELFWSKAQYGSGERNRSDAAGLFFGLLEQAELGKYSIGRRGGKTRIEWNKEEVEKLFTPLLSDKGSETQIAQVECAPKRDCVEEKLLEQGENLSEKKPLFVSAPPITISISINLGEMDKWDMRKMKNLFQYLNGDFSGGEDDS